MPARGAGVQSRTEPKRVGATLKNFLLSFPLLTLFTKIGATCTMQATPTDNKNNMCDILNTYFLYTLLTLRIGHNIER